MSDLVENLREYATWCAEKNIATQAADLIEQQREIEELSKPIDLEVAGDFLISELIDSDAENCREHHYGYEVHLMLRDYANKTRNGKDGDE